MICEFSDNCSKNGIDCTQENTHSSENPCPLAEETVISTVKDIVLKYLQENNFPALVGGSDWEGCSCEVPNIFECENEECLKCQPAREFKTHKTQETFYAVKDPGPCDACGGDGLERDENAQPINDGEGPALCSACDGHGTQGIFGI